MQDFTYQHGRPSTPTGPTRTHKPYGTMCALNTNQPRQETFFDDATPVDRLREHDPLRDSHDLSFAEATVRDSVVDNMLLSLDQFSTGSLFGSSGPGPQYTAYGEDDLFLRDNSYRPPGARHRGHTYTSSRSSDYDIPADESRYTAHHSRARRSNSSNNIGTTVSRKGSSRDVYSSRQTNASYGQLQQMGHLRGSGKKSSKGSGSSSMDFGQSGVLGNQRLSFGKRSASFDLAIPSDRARMAPLKAESVLDRGRMAYMNYPEEYDAAPEPTIPAGPRRTQERPHSPVAYPAQPSYAPPQAPAPRRRGSVHSNNSFRTLRKNKSQPGPNMRAQAQEFFNASTLRDLPPVPSYLDPFQAVTPRTSPFPAQPPVATPQSKPGFFRRVFGGGASKAQPQLSNASSLSIASQMDSSPAPIKQQPTDVNSVYSQTRPRTTPNNSSHIATQLKSLPRALHTASSSNEEAQLPPPPNLGKKPSSFFRRRKKSVSENVKPPVVALAFTPPPKPVLPEPFSPGLSSLRQVMNPYLNDSGRPGDRSDDPLEQYSSEDGMNGERSRGFSPGYMPHKDATVRTVKPNSHENDQTPPSFRGEQLKALPFSSADSPKLKLKVRHGKQAIPNHPQEDTFLADSSSCNEDYSGRATPTGEHSGVDEVRRPSTGLTSSSLRQSEGRSNHLSPHTQTTPRSASVSQSASEAEDEGWVITEPSETTVQERTSDLRSPAAKRVWLDTTLPDTLSETADDLKLPLEGARSSQQSLDKPLPVSPYAAIPTTPNDVFHSATSLPIVQVESRESDTMPAAIEDRSMHAEPTDAERERAFQIYSGDDSSSLKAQAAAMLGDVTISSARTRKAFMDLFNWTGFNILAAMRDLCGKIILKAETQQVDRILMSLSERWCECNPSHGFKAVDVVHTICYSILLLNTDLHVADIESRMTRSQFVRNTLPTVTRVCQDAVKAAGGETLRPHSTHFRRPSLPWNDRSEPNSPAADAGTFPLEVSEEPAEARKSRSRLSIRPPMRSGSEGILSFDSATADFNTLVNTRYSGPIRGWEIQIETVLKEFYDSIRKQRLPLHGAPDLVVHQQPSSNSLSVAGMLRRTPSVLSKAPSDNASYRGRSQADFRSVNSRWASKNRSKQRLYPSSTVASSRTSLDDGSVWSPAGSSSWSRYSYGKTGTSMSMDSLGSHFATGDYQQAIGFANALSQAIIREEGMTIASDEEFSRVAPLLEDETLELVGAPWAKEGILKHKHHLEACDKKAKDRAWSECFAVVEKGQFRLFSFSMNSKSVRQKSKLRPSAGSVVGGGNWMDNAEALDSFPLRQTIASTLPPPGYSKSRPHVFALSLPNGAVHLFQVGTPDIAREFVVTVNYWSARLSKEPLMGGVSSMEYGWGENVINPALIRQDSTPSVRGHMPRPSMTSSIRSSMDHATGTPKPRLAGDKVMLSDWTPPASSMMASTLMEVDQLRALTDYVKNIETDLAHHNELRAPLLITFSPRHPNAARAMANWERKSQYLLREIVKFRTYIDTLANAQVQKQKIYAERQAREKELAEVNEEAAQNGKPTEDDGAKEASEPPSPKTIVNISSPPPAFLLHP